MIGIRDADNLRYHSRLRPKHIGSCGSESMPGLRFLTFAQGLAVCDFCLGEGKHKAAMKIATWLLKTRLDAPPHIVTRQEVDTGNHA